MLGREEEGECHPTPIGLSYMTFARDQVHRIVNQPNAEIRS
jgi:hypothetical protein